MVFVYGAARGNAQQAVSEYRALFPTRRAPYWRTIVRAFRILRDIGRTLNQAGSIPGRKNYRMQTDSVLTVFDNNPQLSTRRAALQLGTSHRTVFNVLRNDGRHPYHFAPAQYLLPLYKESRTPFCEWFLTKTRNDQSLPNSVL